MDSQEIEKGGVARKESTVFQFIIFELALSLLFLRNSLCPGFIIDAKGAPETKNIIGKKGGDEIVLVVFVVPPVSCNHLLRYILVNVGFQNWTAFKQEKQSGGKRVGNIILRSAERLGELVNGVVHEISAVARKFGDAKVASSLDQIRLDADFVETFQ
ncbi:MAG: hypothetical protein ABSB35_06505 [Bryobacteraceae bacterium]|jgi:hypothetical protein